MVGIERTARVGLSDRSYGLRVESIRKATIAVPKMIEETVEAVSERVAPKIVRDTVRDLQHDYRLETWRGHYQKDYRMSSRVRHLVTNTMRLGMDEDTSKKLSLVAAVELLATSPTILNRVRRARNWMEMYADGMSYLALKSTYLDDKKARSRINDFIKDPRSPNSMPLSDDAFKLERLSLLRDTKMESDDFEKPEQHTETYVHPESIYIYQLDNISLLRADKKVLRALGIDEGEIPGLLKENYNNANGGIPMVMYDVVKYPVDYLIGFINENETASNMIRDGRFNSITN